jgi:inward rectifier potassium channel
MAVFKKTNNINDLGFDNRTEANRRRTINPDGTFNIKRKNGFWDDFHIYQWAITCKWSTYWLTVLTIYITANFFFASLYFLIGPEHIQGANHASTGLFWQCYFFSLQTFTTVGYGGLHPTGMLTNTLAGFEAFLGLMTFALATGALYGRFSKPEARLKYSENALISPFRDGQALMLMIANNKKGNLVEVSAKLNFSWLEKDADGKPVRNFSSLNLYLDKIAMLSLSWTIVHPIDSNSPLYNFTPEDYLEKDVEVFVFISCYDDTFSQTVQSRYAYIGAEIVHNAKFRRAFHVDEDGYTVLDVKSVGLYDKLS